MIRILLAAINAKYIHSNLAVYSLQAYAREALKRDASLVGSAEETQFPPERNQSAAMPASARSAEEAPSVELQDPQTEDSVGAELTVAEYTINQPLEQILQDLYRRRPDVLCFSCYLWNMNDVDRLIREIPKLLPGIEIWLGGPEVSFHTEQLLRERPSVRGIMRGEGEETFLELVRHYRDQSPAFENIEGITWRGEGKIAVNPDRPPIDLSSIPFVYRNMELFRNRIIYYESSRGCPFSCSYCLSSVDGCLRFRDTELVKKELQFFLDEKIPQVKFVDRTFNCRHDHALAIWRYLAEHDNGITNFHFEIAADLLNEEELALIQTLRPGLIQLEVGVQSTNERTIQEIRRVMDFGHVSRVVRRVHAGGNVHQHLDLIVGLPYENYDRFHLSFNDVYALRPQQLQIGFLKVLKGSYMETRTAEYELLYTDAAPYEVLSTRWLSYGDVIRLKGIEEMVEVYYNSGQFVNTLELLETEFEDAFRMYESLAQYYDARGLFRLSHTRIARYEILYRFIGERLRSEAADPFGVNEAAPADRERTSPVAEIQTDAEAKGRTESPEPTKKRLAQFRELLTLDLYLRENVKNRPEFAGAPTVSKETAAAFYDREEKEHRYLIGYEGYDRRQMRKMTHLECVRGELILFDYRNRDRLMNQASVYVISPVVSRNST